MFTWKKSIKYIFSVACGLIVQSTVFLPMTQENIDQKQNSKKP